MVFHGVDTDGVRAVPHLWRGWMRVAGRAAAAAFVFLLSVTATHAGLDRSIEKMLGKQARDAVESQYVVIAQGPAADYVSRIGMAIVAVSPRHDIQYTFKILDTEQINAFALPWGYVYVTTGMLRFVDSSDQLSGVMGHEIAHVAERHSVQQFKKQFWSTLLFGVIDAPATVATAGQIGATLYLLRYSRKDEQAADKLGAGYAYLAGYDASQLAGFLAKLDKQQQHQPSTIEVYLSTHPTGERRQERLAEIPEVNQKDPAAVTRTAKGYLDRHLANQAVVEYRRAVEVAPQDATAQLGLAQAYGELGERDLARQALARATELGARDSSAARAAIAAAPAPAADPTKALPAADQQQIKQTVAAAAEWSANAQDPAKQMQDRSKSLEDKVRALARRMSMAGSLGRPTFEGQRVLEKADVALYLIAETSDEVGAIAEGLKSLSAGATEVAQLLETAAARAASADEQAQWRALTADMTAGIARAGEETPNVTSQAVEAAKRADAAAGQLGSAVNTLASDIDVFGRRPGLTPFAGLAEGDVDRALKTAREALESARKATAALRGWRTSELTWQISAAYLDTPAPQRAALTNMCASMLDMPAKALTADPAAGFGAAVLTAMTPKPIAKEASAAGAEPAPAAASSSQGGKASPGGSAPAPESPPSATSPEGGNKASTAEPAPPAATPQPPTGEDLMLKLILADVKREAEARAKWQGSGSGQTAQAN
jgi:predicted Zn-dependent protease